MSHDLAHLEALPLMPVPPRWVEELLGCWAPGDSRSIGVEVQISGPCGSRDHAHSRCGLSRGSSLAPEGRGRVSRRHRVTRDNRPTSRAVLELHPRHRRADGRRARSLHGIQCRPPRRVRRSTRRDVYCVGGWHQRIGSLHSLSRAEDPGTPVENPRQTPSWRYSSRYGPLPPCFSRATIVDICGTPHAADWGHRERRRRGFWHAGQFDAQVEETLLNLEALIQATSAKLPWRQRGASPTGRLARLREVGLGTPNASASCSSTAALAREPSPSPSRKSVGLSYWWKWKALRNSNRRV